LQRGQEAELQSGSGRRAGLGGEASWPGRGGELAWAERRAGWGWEVRWPGQGGTQAGAVRRACRAGEALAGAWEASWPFRLGGELEGVGIGRLGTGPFFLIVSI
jgi:hypothetical protein